MRNLSALIVASMVVLSSFSVQASAPTPDWYLDFLDGKTEGFDKPEDMPEALTEASKKVYVLIFALRQKHQLSSEQFKSLQSSMEYTEQIIQDARQVRPDGRLSNPKALARGLTSNATDCARVGETFNVSCDINQLVTACAAFATDGGAKVWTAAHCIETLAQERADGALQVVYMYDQQGNKVFGPTAITDLGLSKEALDYQWSIETIQDDSVAIVPPKPVTHFFEIETGPEEGSQVIAIGFPNTTSSEEMADAAPGSERGARPRINGKDGAYGELRFSQGRLVSKEESLALKDIFEPTLFEAYQAADNILLSTADGYAGFSGGPALTSTGKVIGVFSTAASSMVEDATIRTTTLFVRPKSWKTIPKVR